MSAPAFALEMLGRQWGEYRRPCPLCERGPKDDALAIRVDDRGCCWVCHRCGFTGSEPRPSHEASRPAPAPRQDVPTRWSLKAERIWRASQALRGTVAQTYLEGRGCVLPPADGDLRFLPSRDGHPPCLVARVTDWATGEPMSLHFTRLRADGSGKAGTERDKLLLRGHQKRGGVIRLWPDDAVTSSLAVAEGIESALCAAHFHAPAWSAIDASNLSGLGVIAGIEQLVVFADHDAAGINAARQVVARWQAAGVQAEAYLPPTPGEDAADVVARHRGAA